MPIATQPGGAALTFSNNFWGKEDAGFAVLMERMRQARTTSEDLRRMYKERAEIEEGYAKRLMRLAKQPLGKDETGCLSESLKATRRELERTAQSHLTLSENIRNNLELPLTEFVTKQGESRKVQQGHIEKVHRNKVNQETLVAKSREKYEQECIKLNGFIAQQNMLTGKELEKNNLKLERAQSSAMLNDKEYQMYVRALTETVLSWNEEWKNTCDKFQVLEEDRIGFMKSNLWEYANIVSETCVKDDESCETIRKELEKVEVHQDVEDFIRNYATGPEMQRPPKYRNFYTDPPIDGEPQYTLANFSHIKENFPPPRNRTESESTRGSRVIPPSEGRRSSLANSRPSQGRNIPRPPSVPSTAPRTSSANVSRPPSRMINTQRSSPEPSFGRDQPTHLERRLSMIAGRDMSGSTSPLESPLERFDGRRSPSPAVVKTSFPEFKVSYPIKPSSDPNDDNYDNAIHNHQQQTGPSFSTPIGMRVGKRDRPPSVNYNEDPIDPRGPVALAVGKNVFEVDTVSMKVQEESAATAKLAEVDPIAAALRELKNMTSGGGRSKEQSRKPVPDFENDTPPYVPSKNVSRSPSPRPEVRRSPSPQPVRQQRSPSPSSNYRPRSRNSSRNSAPPARHASILSNGGNLAPPAPGFTSAELQQTTQHYTQQAQAVISGNTNFLEYAAEHRSQSPLPYSRRSSSPLPQAHRTQPPAQYHPHNASTAPSASAVPEPQRTQSPAQYHPHMVSAIPAQPSAHEAPVNTNGAYPAAYYHPQQSHHMYQSSMYVNGPMQYPQRSASPQPYHAPHQAAPPRSHSSMGYYPSGGASQQNPYPVAAPMWSEHRSTSTAPAQYNGTVSQRSSSRNGYHAPPPQNRPASVIMRSSSRTGYHSPAPKGTPIHGHTADGRPILFYVKAIYDYDATIPQEISFVEGQVIVVLRTQEDGWWEGEIPSTRARGLFPSNFVTRM